MEDHHKIAWYYNFNDIIKKYKLYENIIFFNLSWVNKYYN